MTLFTIILPTFKRAHLIKRAINSVIEQTYTNWELIVVDDESEDNTEEIVESFRDDRIRYIYKRNNERSAARNTGIRYAKGEYICFLDSDDYYLNNHLEEFNKIISEKKNPVAVLYCNTIEDDEGKLTEVKILKAKARNNIEQVLQNIIGCPRTCVHSDIFKIYKFNESVHVGEDTELWVRALKKYPLIENDKYTVVYTSHDNRTVHISNKENIKAHIKLIKKIISEDKEHYISTKVRKQTLSYAYFNLARHYIYKSNKIRAILNLIISFIYAPFNSQTQHKIFLIINLLFKKKLKNINKVINYSVRF